MTLKPPMTTYLSPTASASATTPARSGPENSSGDMTGAYRGGQKSHCLLRELLTDLEPLRRRQRHVAGAKLLSLFAIDLCPLSLVAHREQRRFRSRLHV